MKGFLVLLLSAAIAFGCELVEEEKSQSKFYEILTNHGIKDRISERFGVFRENMRIVNEHNKKGESFCMALNQFSVMFQEELDKIVSLKVPADAKLPTNLQASELKDIPNDVDLRNLTGPVEDQGQCGSCWAFAAAHVLTGAVMQKTNKINMYSTQESVDCIYGRDGCEGGWSEDVWTYAKTHFEQLGSLYPYQARYGQCKNPAGHPIVSGYSECCAKNETAMAGVAATHPVRIYFDVVNDFFQYSSGVYQHANCATGTHVNHVMTLVGYGTDPQHGDYWLVKNSWAASWGDQGFVKIKRGVNTCNIGVYGVSYPTLI